MAMGFTSTARSVVGLVRSGNEDSGLIDCMPTSTLQFSAQMRPNMRTGRLILTLPTLLSNSHFSKER